MDPDVENRAGAPDGGQPGGSEYLHNSGVALYNMDKRPRRDSYWTIAYVSLAALVFFWAIPCFTHTDPHSGMYNPGFYYNSTSCDIEAYQAVHPPVSFNVDQTFLRAFKKSISIWLPITAVLAVLSSALYLVLFRRFAKAMVTATILFSVGSGLLFALVCFFVGAIPFGVILLIFTIITAVFYWWIRAQLRMCAELLAIAGRGLNENLGLIPAAIGIKLVGLCVLVYGAAGFFSAVNVGHVEKMPNVVMHPNGPESAVCLDSMYNVVPCCRFKTETWAGAFAFFASCFISWTGMLIMQLKLYTVADTISQWYFSPSLAGNTFGSSSSDGMRPGSVRLALDHCLRSSFGSVAFAAAILAILRMIRRSLERASRKNIICCIINCVAQPLLAMMEKFTRFATIAAAITGDAFVPAAKSVFDTLKRNFLQTYSVWWVPDSVLQFAVGLLSLTWAGIVFFATYAANKNSDNVWPVTFATAAVAFVFMLYALLFVAGLLLDAINTIYICYAMDKDQRRVTHPEIHAVYSQIPGLAVENPDGGVMYGEPVPQQQPQATVPPPYPGVYAPAQYPPAGYPAYPAYPSYPPAAAAPGAQMPPAAYPYAQPHYPAVNQQ
ncbi:hypothetical protein Agub_g3582 [Astrephomene gubernaculifera]|uniref:Choline transporter-like protein n=1 Tax=Astrephomene gubernaculifera TaxID=47775 RepID=A0AAD3DIV4_9CHLO|nr:hypothetical protein Agub_g3582 [Astrephomene gubernaculifera]